MVVEALGRGRQETMVAHAPPPYQPSAAEGRERLLTAGRQPADAGEARAWLARLDREAASIRAQLGSDKQRNGKSG